MPWPLLLPRSLQLLFLAELPSLEHDLALVFAPIRVPSSCAVVFRTVGGFQLSMSVGESGRMSMSSAGKSMPRGLHLAQSVPLC